MPFKKTYKKSYKTKKLVKKPLVGAVNKVWNSGIGWKDIVHDVMFLKSIVNAEKKMFQTSNSSTQYVGQLNGNATGHYVLDTTPLPQSGSAFNARTGSSIRVHSARYSLQFIQQSNTAARTTLRVDLYYIQGTPVTPSNLINGAISANAFLSAQNGGTQIRDMFSVRDPDYRKTYKLITSRKVIFPSDSLTSLTLTKDLVINLKLGNHIRFDNDSITNTVGQYIMCIVADNGNYSTTTASTLVGISPSGTASLTGFTLNYVIDHYFFDN